MGPILSRARSDARALAEGGCDALIVENMGDLPYLNGAVYPETVAAMTLVCHEVIQAGLPMGVQILAAANEQALAVATATGASFIRVEGFAYGHLADEGWMNACAGPLLRKRAQLGAHNIKIWADVQKKHAAHAATGDLGLRELVEGHVFAGADALIITGRATGQPTSLEDLKTASHIGRPVVVGSGVTPENAEALAKFADALIVGSWLKEEGNWQNPVDRGRVETLCDRINRHR